VRVDVQLNPAVEPWPRLLDGVLAAEAAGYDTTWAFDHFDGAMLEGSTMLECFTLLGALAAATTRIGLGSLVVNAANRPAGVVATGASSVQAISAGRFVLGLGAGASPASRWGAEHRALGIELAPAMAERHRRLEGALDLLDRLWSADRPAELATFARPSPRPPVVLGVNSLPLALLAGRRCDGINVRAGHEALVELLDGARRARDLAGRGDEPWDASVWTWFDPALVDPSHPERRRWSGLGVGRLVLVCLQPHDPVALARPVT